MRKGFKQTEVGVIPEDWEIKPIKNLNFDISDGNYSSRYPKASDFRAFGVPFIRANNIKGLKVVDDDLRYISEEQHAELLSGHLKKNDILITTRGDIGQIAFVPDRHIDSNINAQLVRINVGKTGHSHRYVGYVLTFGNVQKQFESLQTGSALKQLPVGKLITLNIPLPPTLAEQEAIAEALSDADALIESLETLLAKKRQVKQGAMSELLTGKRRLVESGEWKKTLLGKLAKIQRGASPRPIDDPIWFDENSSVGWVRISDVTSSGMYLYETTQRLSSLGIEKSRPVEKGSLIMSIAATVGRPIITKIDACIHDGFVVFDNLQVEKHFLYYVLKFIEGDWSKHGQTGSQMNLNTGLINRTEVLLPPTKAEQTAIAEILSDMDAEIRAVEEKLSKARAVKAGMMSALLGGRVRLV